MRMRRGLRRWLSGAILLAVLFTQVVATAYACPTRRGDADNPPAAQAGMPCADMLAKSAAPSTEQAGQCLHHCQFVSTVAAGDSGPTVPAVALVTRHFVLAPNQPPAVVDGVPWPQRERVHDRVPRLAHSVAHCCYRL